MAVSTDISNAIKVARVWCIYFMVLVHVNPGFSAAHRVPLADVDIVILLRSFFSGVLGRASVPLLSIISGYLAVIVLSRTRYGRYVFERFKVLIMPMIFWNALGLALAMLAYKYLSITTGTYGQFIDKSWFQHLYGSIGVLNYDSYNEALKFLRDLFVVSLLSPLLLILAKKIPFITLAVIILVGSFVYLHPIIYRGQILQFFYIGILISFYPHVISWVEKYRLPICALFVFIVIVYLLQAYLVIPETFLVIGIFEWFEWIMRLVTSMVTWITCCWIARCKCARIFHMFERDIYLVYLSHVVIIGVMWIAWKRVFGLNDQPVYLLFYLLSPIVVLVLAPIMRKVVSYLPAIVQYFIKGKVTSASLPSYSTKSKR